MSQQDIPLAPFGGINQDDSLISPPSGQSTFDRGDYTYGRNVRIGSSVENNTGGTETLPSSLEIDDYYVWDGAAWVTGTIPAGTNKCRGLREDFDENCIFYAVYNSNEDHQILKFDKTTRRIYELLKWSGLNFAATNIISMARVNKYLVFTCREAGFDGNVNAPRVVNTDTIHETKYNLSSNFSEYHISFAKWPPLAPPIIKATTVDSTTYPTGNIMLNRGMFQFCYRYVYYGGMRSTWGPASNFYTIQNGTAGIQNVTTFQIIAPGYIYDYENNTYFGHASQKFYEVVEFIEFAFRQSVSDNWKLFKRMQTGDLGDDAKYIDFSNNGPVAVVSDDEINQAFDSVPLASGSCEVIDNRVMFADNDDDLEIPDFSVENVEIYKDGTFAIWGGDVMNSSVWSSLGAYASVIANKLRPAQFNFKERGIYKLAIQYQHWSGRKSLAISPDNWTYLIPINSNDLAGAPNPINYALGFNIPTGINPPDWAVGYQILRSDCLNIEFFIEGIADEFKFLGIDTGTPPTPGVTPSEIQTIVNNWVNNLISGKNVLPTAPAKPVDNYDRVELAAQIANNLRTEKIVGSLAAAGRIYIDISNWYLQTDNGGTVSNPANSLYYSFRKGDRVRFIGSTGSGFSSPKVTVYDVPIVDFDGRGLIIDKPSGIVTVPTKATMSNLPKYFKIEIYRPKPFSNDENTQTIPFYEIGEWYPVTNPTTVSRDFAKRDFRWTNVSAVSAISGSSSNGLDFAWFSKLPIINGDIHWNYKTLYWTKTGTVNYLQSQFNQMNPERTNAAGDWEHNEGRPNIAYRYSPINIRKKTQVRFGLKYLEDSIFTAINTFLDGNQFIYPSEYGTIRGMRNTSNAMVESVGNILLILGERESWSVYVNRGTLESLDGQTQVSISDQVLGSFNTLLGSQGTLNPESISSRNGRVIWWNARKGVWVRYSRDGMTEISKYGLKNWFKDISMLIIDEYQTSTPPEVISVFDEYHDEWITRIDHASLPETFKEYASYKCATFSEKNAEEGGKRWKAFFDYIPDRFAAIDNEVYGIIGSKVHIHEEGADFCSLYGTYYPPQLELAVPGRKKRIWQTITLIATDKWSFERIRGDWKSNSATIQESRLKLTDLEDREGIWVSEIKNDKNTPNAASEQAGVINGDPMRGKTLRLLMQLDPYVDYLSVFNWLEVGFSDSPKNTKN